MAMSSSMELDSEVASSQTNGPPFADLLLVKTLKTERSEQLGRAKIV